MATYAYLQVTTDKQDIESQRFGILDYANTKSLGKIVFIEETASGKIGWQKRALGGLMNETCQAGDTVLFGEFSAVGRSTLQVLEVLQAGLANEIEIHVVKQKVVMDDSIQSTIFAAVFGLAVEIEQSFISTRTQESLSKKKADIAEKGYFISAKGQKITSLGRPKGKAKTTKLDKKEAEIREYLAKGVGKRSIAKIVECSPATLYAWMKRKGIMTS